MAKLASFAEFRQKLAFRENSKGPNKDARQQAEQWVIELVGTVPEFYGKQLDRMNLWTRIDGGLMYAASKAESADDFCADLLQHICAEADKVTHKKAFAELLKRGKDIDVSALKSAVKQKHLLLCTYGRDLWEADKAERQAAYEERMAIYAEEQAIGEKLGGLNNLPNPEKTPEVPF